jgi:hypothetical protein
MLLTIMRHYSSSVLLKFPSISSSESHVLGAVIFFKKWKGLKKRITILCLPTALLYATRGAAELSTSHLFSFVLAILSLGIPSCFYGNSVTSWIVQDFKFPIYYRVSHIPRPFISPHKKKNRTCWTAIWFSCKSKRSFYYVSLRCGAHVRMLGGSNLEMSYLQLQQASWPASLSL